MPRNFGSDRKVVFRIERGAGSAEISASLAKDGLIWWGPLFRLYAIVSGISGKLQAGYYYLDTTMSIAKISQKFSEGDIARETITIPEGFTSEQIYEKLKNLTISEIVNLTDYEGYLFPDTYEIAYGASAEEVIKMMTDNFTKKTAGLEIKPEIVVMASILEKEVKTKEEKELVAGVLWKRIKFGMPLQVDASMWTYEHLGLPAKPLANPGLDSISAAIYPKNSLYWYYLSTLDGETIFSKTLGEHNIAKARYLSR